MQFYVHEIKIKKIKKPIKPLTSSSSKLSILARCHPLNCLSLESKYNAATGKKIKRIILIGKHRYLHYVHMYITYPIGRGGIKYKM